MSECARSCRKRFRLSAVGVMLTNSFPSSRNICGEQSHVYSIQENCTFQQCNLVVSPMCFLLISLCSGTTAALFTQSQDCGWRQWCYWFIWRSCCINTEALRRDGWGLWGGGAWGCGDCVIRRHAPSCICDITAAFLSTKLEQLRPLSNSSSPVHPLSHILASLFSQTLKGDFSSVWVLNPCS